MAQELRLRVSPSVMPFQEKAIKTWGLKPWKGIYDDCQDVLFFGLYIKDDYEVFRRHKGKKVVFWCGSDILNLLNNYEFRRVLKLFPETEHWCENEVEKEKLNSVGIEVKGVVPSFLEDIYKFPVSFKPSTEPHVWLCGHPKREREYGWELVEWLAEQLPEFTFHLYGVDRPEDPNLLEQLNEYDLKHPNIIRHGKVSQEQFNKEIRAYHCGFRPNEHDGFSEVIAKSILLGQYPISKIPYPGVWTYKDNDELLERFRALKDQKEPNMEAYKWFRKNVNKFPWCKN